MRKRSSLQEIQRLAQTEISEQELKDGIDILKTRKVALFIVSYNAETHLEQLISRIPHELMPLFAEIFIIDDSSTDSSFQVARELSNRYPAIHAYCTPFNRGYGGNQKLGYMHCLERGYDLAILLHGDGQYPPEFLPRILAGFTDEPDAVFASRMINKAWALRGGMPFYKWVGNQVLTAFENKLLGIHLSEFHTGFRAYKTAALRQIPFAYNSDSFHFDTEIIIQAVATKWKIKEVEIPTYYGDEKCHVKGVSYALNCLKAIVRYFCVNLGLYYQRNYDFGQLETKSSGILESPNSLHQYLLRYGAFNRSMKSIEFGAQNAIFSSEIAHRVKDHTVLDAVESVKAARKSYDCCVALDVIEHLNDPENFLSKVFQLMRVNAKLYISTANVCYLPVRLSLLMGQFNYGKRGILDKTHKHLFSVRSFKRLLIQQGFRIDEIRGFPPPLTDFVSSSRIMRVFENVHAFFSTHFPKLFAYRFLVVARRIDGLHDIFERTMNEIPLVPVAVVQKKGA